ncbi:transglutaminase-like domain-containing protein [Gudongella sp. DL1XJH-153]|uniref:transglutaminase-like domain-containing protein n=1 Tax=Gudongella sp. DL1XJH-153 TaxID=3409804 RepID=UPI003BB507A9
MKRRVLSLLLVFVFLFGSIGISNAAESFGVTSMDNSQLRIDSVAYGSNVRVMVEKGTEKYFYSMNNTQEHIPLQLGDGLYTVKLLKNIEGNKYQVLGKSEMNVSQWNENVYLTSSQPVYWANQSLMPVLANALFHGMETDYQKVVKAYNHITNNIKYDYDKINYINNSYIPSIDDTITSGQGICYDYSALFAGLMRSQGIPTKLVKGYTAGVDVYHAWNEVYVNGSWMIIDTTFDAAYYQNGMTVEMAKSELDYQKVREY